MRSIKIVASFESPPSRDGHGKDANMRHETLIYLTLLNLILLQLNPVGATHLGPRLLTRRQSGGEAEKEKESTTPSSKPEQQGSNNNGQPQADRLYPDLTRGPVFLPPFNAHPSNQHNAQLPPFVPFNTPLINMATGQRLNADQQAGPFGPRILAQPRPMTSAERSQSNAFVDGLGKRLLAMVGINNANASQASEPNAQSRSDAGAETQLGPFQNVTILNELMKRTGMLMSGLSKMYNSTVRDQLNLLNERLQEETKNGTNTWQQIMSQRVPAYFNQMAQRVSSVQEQLNRAWRDLIQVAQGKGGTQSGQNPQTNVFTQFGNQFFNPNERLDGSQPAVFFGNQADGNNFLHQLGQSLGLNNQQQQPELANRLSEFWHQQVQPQIGMVRNQMGRIWRDLTTSGALNPNMLRSPGAGKNNDNNNTNSDLVDNLLKEADSESAEFALASGDRSQMQPPTNSSGPVLNQQMFNRLMNAQRELNRVWQGLSQSIQNAVANARVMLNPQARGAPQQPMGSNQEPAGGNEISDKVQELNKVQRDADVLFDTIQQEQRESQQRQTFADRFRGFMNNVDLRNLNRLPDQIGAQVDRFGRVIGNFWETIPERWENMMTQRQNQANQARMEAEIMNSRSSTAKPASATPVGQNP